MNKTALIPRFAFQVAISSLLTTFTVLSVASAAENEKEYTLKQVATHNKADDCWMAIRGRVYDFTEFMSIHPAPPAIMTPWCGKEATEGMTTKGYGADHSLGAWEMTAEYLIGTLIEE